MLIRHLIDMKVANIKWSVFPAKDLWTILTETVLGVVKCHKTDFDSDLHTGSVPRKGQWAHRLEFCMEYEIFVAPCILCLRCAYINSSIPHRL